jgi:hypothetical protein
MSKVLMESLKLDLPALAEMIRSKGRGKDTILAHITPKEAALLKRRGGSGTTNPDTGLPEFQDSFDIGSYFGGDTGGDFTPAQSEIGTPLTDFQIDPNAQYSAYPQAQDYGNIDIGFGPGVFTPRVSAADIKGRTFTPEENAMFGYTQAAPAPAPVSRGVVTPPGKKEEEIFSNKDLARLGIGTTVLGGLTAQNLARTRQAQQQAGQSQAELQALGTPYQAQGKELVRAAQAGELTPANQQIAAAARAQANQAVATRGGVGQQQAQNAIADLTARLLQGQYDLGLKVMNIGDNYVSGAIKTGLQADQMVNQANQQFYASLAQMAAPFLLGQQPVYQVTPGVK